MHWTKKTDAAGVAGSLFQSEPCPPIQRQGLRIPEQERIPAGPDWGQTCASPVVTASAAVAVGTSLTDSPPSLLPTTGTAVQQSDPCPEPTRQKLHHRCRWIPQPRIRGTGLSVPRTSTASGCCVWRNGCCSAMTGTGEGHVVPGSRSVVLPAHGESGVPAASGQQSHRSRCSPPRPGSRHRSHRSPLTTSPRDRRRHVLADCFPLTHVAHRRDR